ncbi:MAG TPA: glycosyltransferase family 4 protein [Gemmatimonadaceae bacterium]
MDILGGQAVQLARLHEQLRNTPGVEVSFLPMNPRLPGPFRLLQRVKFLRTVATSIGYWSLLLTRMRRYDVVHAFSPSYWAFLLGPVPALLVARAFGRGALLNYHSGEAEDHLRNWRTAVPLAKLAHRIVVPSDYLRDVFARFGLRSESIHNFVDADTMPYRERSAVRPVFLSNRNFEAHYNVACCLRAFARVQERIPDASLTVAGYGSQRAALEALADELGLQNVRFTGRVTPETMARLLNEADILLNSPDIDNMPLSLIEAQAAGLPIVSTSTGGIPYVVEDGETGLLVPPNDDAAMAKAALRLLEEPGLALRLTRAARQACLARFSWPAVEEAWVRVYRELAAVRSSNRAAA